MMSRLRYWIMDPIYFFFGQLRYMATDPRILLVVGIAVMGALFALGGNTLKMIAFWIGIVLVVALLVTLVLWVLRRSHARGASNQLGAELSKPSTGDKTVAQAGNADVEALRERLREAVKTIKTSRLGQTRGTEALYELPWYMIIGNPAAGKSTAIVNSGLRFPFADSHGSIVQGIGGTRNCDWYFTTEGILLDTAGRYSVETENRSEWLSFLELLRRNRPRAPINGIIIAASIPELTGNSPEFAINLAKKLRQRVQELTDWLEVIPPVYVVFTKADLIDGFNDFFRLLDDGERHKVWGSTLPFKPDEAADPDAQFDRYFDELSEGLKEMSLSQMSLNRGNTLAPGMLTLPLEFTSIKPTLRTFITTLFEDNPFQFRPVFRGFYFTSAMQESAPVHHASERIAQRYDLAPAEATPAGDTRASTRSYFLMDLFRKVIFADKQLVRQYSSRGRQHTRYAVLVGAALALGLALGGWAWSYTNNQQLVSNVQADLNKVASIQKGRIDLQSRLEALQILQDRLQQLQQYRHDHPLMLGLGLYQGNTIEAKVRSEYFNGMRQLMVAPVTQNLGSYLKQVVLHANDLTATNKPDAKDSAKDVANGTYQAPSPTNTEDAYNALRAYLMLADPQHVEPVQLSDQLTRFWRGWLEDNRGLMTRDQLIGSADRLMSYYVTLYNQPGWPTITDQDALVDDTRQALRHVMSGMPAINRVYAEIKARAATRFPPISVASIVGDKSDHLLVGSYAISGTFTREAWDGYVRGAIRDAANNQLSTKDWVLQSSQQTDLTLSGSPEQIQKQLQTLYDKDYVAQWQQFIKGVAVAPFGSFTDAVNDMNLLGDPDNSPLRAVMDKVYAETSWDNPSTLSQGLQSAKGGFSSWFKREILRRTSASDLADNGSAPSASANSDLQYGPIGQAFSGITQLMVARDNNPPLFRNYLNMLNRLRTHLEAIHNQGDPGPGTLKLLQQTLNSDGGGNDPGLSSGLQMVDGQMLNGLDGSQRATLRPLLLRPLIQTFQALIDPAEHEINRAWKDQVYTPFEQDLAQKAPFNPNGQVQAVDSEIGQIFGPSGAISNFASNTLGPLVNRRGNTLTPRQWADMGINLSPQLMTGFAQWVAPLGQTTSSAGQTMFQIRPQPGSGGISEYTIDINGQTLRYQNTPPEWASFAWDASQPNPVAKVTAVTYDGRNVTIENFSGADALGQLFHAAKGGQDKSTGVYNLTWSDNGISVSVNLKLISGANTNANGTQKQGLAGTTLPATIAGQPNAAPATGINAAPTTSATAAKANATSTTEGM